MVLTVEAHYGTAFRNEIHIDYRGQDVATLKLAHQLAVQAGIQSQHSALVEDAVPLVLPDTNL